MRSMFAIAFDQSLRRPSAHGTSKQTGQLSLKLGDPPGKPASAQDFAPMTQRDGRTKQLLPLSGPVQPRTTVAHALEVAERMGQAELTGPGWGLQLRL